MAGRWAAVLGRAVAKMDGGWKIDLDQGEIRFVVAVDGRGEGLGGFDVAVRNPSDVQRRAQALRLTDPNGQIMLSGARLRLVGA